MNYFNEFQRVLKELGFSGKYPRLLDLRIDLLRFSILEYFLAILFIPWTYIDWNTVQFEDMMENKDFHGPTIAAWKHLEFQEEFVAIVERLIPIGALD